MKKLSAVVNIARMPSIARRSYYTISTTRTCRMSKTRARSTYRRACGTSKTTLIVRIKITARTRTIRNSAIANPSFFFKIDGNREVS